MLYRSRWWWLGTMAVNLGAAYVMTWWFLRNPAVESTLLTPEEVDQLVNPDFAGYYSEHAATSFAASVWTNNALVAALCIAFGVLAFPVLSVLYSNILNLAIIASIMIRHGRADVFFGLILPHGMLELTAVFVAAGWGCGSSGRGSSRATGLDRRRWRWPSGPRWSWRSGWWSSCS